MTDHVVVTGTGSAATVPDVVVVSVRVHVEQPDASQALAHAGDAARAVLDAAAGHGVAPVDRHTTGLGLGTRWDHDRVVGYTAHQRLRLRVRETAVVGALLTALADAVGDALGIDGVAFEVADPAPLHVRAREAAFADARARAEQYAALAGRRLGQVLRVVEADGEGPAPVGRGMALAADVAGSMPLEGGRSSVEARVTVRFALDRS